MDRFSPYFEPSEEELEEEEDMEEEGPAAGGLTLERGPAKGTTEEEEVEA